MLSTTISVRYLSRSIVRCQLAQQQQSSKIQVKAKSNILRHLRKSEKYESFLKSEEEKFEHGRQHLASMMDEKSENFDQQKIDDAVKYLFPSGLMRPNARPMMKPPAEVYPKKKIMQCGLDGRPFHHLYYTNSPNYYQLMHDAAMLYEDLKYHESLTIYKTKSLDVPESNKKTVVIKASQWISAEELSTRLLEKVSAAQHEALTALLTRLAEHPFSQRADAFLLALRIPLCADAAARPLPAVQTCPETGRRFVDSFGQKKRAFAELRLWLHGDAETGTDARVNGAPLLDEFPALGDRQQVLFPLLFAGLLGRVSFEARTHLQATSPDMRPAHVGRQLTADGRAPLWKNPRERPCQSARSGALRLALARAVACTVSPAQREQLRAAGLLTLDMRLRERTYPGHDGARDVWTWKPR